MERNSFNLKIKRFKNSLLIYFFLFHTLLNSNECKIMSSYNQLFNKIRILSETINTVYNDKKDRIATFSSSDNAEETIVDHKYIFQLTTSLNEINTIKGTVDNTNGISMIDLDKCKNILNVKNS